MNPYKAALLPAFLMFGIRSASAANFSFTGNFNQDDDVEFFTFSVSSLSNVTLETLSFSGGINSAGSPIAGGGFVPFLHLWDSAGIDLSGVEPSIGDAFYNINLTAGSYIVALTQNSNRALGDLPGGVLDPTQFDHFGQGNFTAAEFSFTPMIPGAFYAPDGSQRNNFWALDIRSVESAQMAGVSTVPIPGALVLMASALAAFPTLVRRLSSAP